MGSAFEEKLDELIRVAERVGYMTAQEDVGDVTFKEEMAKERRLRGEVIAAAPAYVSNMTVETSTGTVVGMSIDFLGGS